MAFFDFLRVDRPGPGVRADEPRKKGAARFAEVFRRDGFTFYLSGALALLSALPFIGGVWLAIVTQSLLILLLAGILGGMLAAPQLCGLCDTVLRSLRDEPGYWWATYCRAWKRNAKATVAPGAIFGTLLAACVFALCYAGGNTVVSIASIVGIFLLLGVAQFVFAQLALLDLPLLAILKNALFLFLGYLPRAVLGAVWQLAYCCVLLLIFPYSTVLLFVTGFWLPVLLALMAIYPVLDKTFQLEEKIKAMRDAELQE